jgi:hypothetical protein
VSPLLNRPFPISPIYIHESMTIWSTLPALQGPAVLFCVILGPSILPRILGYLQGRRNPAIPRSPRPPLPFVAKAVLALHTIYRLYALFRPPFNVFTHHGLPLFTSNDVLRRYLVPSLNASHALSRLDSSNPRSYSELLSTKLASLDNRLLYSRYGHDPLLTCTWCHSSTDFLLAALPGILGAYLGITAVLGVLGLHSVGGDTARGVKRAWRGRAAWLLAISAAGEVGIRYMWELRVTDGDAVQVSFSICRATLSAVD